MLLLLTASNSGLGGSGVESSRKDVLSVPRIDGVDEEEIGELLMLDMIGCVYY
jgi:hypothetical protein